MKKLPITKEAFEKSKYFKNKYGKLEYVSESGKLFKTEKGKILKFNEAIMGGGEYEPSDEEPLAEWKVGEIVDIDSWQVMWEYDDDERLPEKGWKIVNVERDENYDDCDGYCYTIVNIRNPKLKVEVSASALVERKSVKKSGRKLKESTKKFGKKFTKENVEAPDEDLTCPNCRSNDVYVDAGYATCGDCEYSWELKDYTESASDIANDPAYVCPYCGGHNCEFSDGEDIGSGLQDGYFDGATVNTTFWCMDCEKPYNVQFKLKVSDVYPDESGDFDED